MAGETRDLRHGGIFPDHYLVLAVAVRGHDFIAVLGPGKIADLAPGVDLVDCCAAKGVVEDNSSICCSTSGCQEASLVR